MTGRDRARQLLGLAQRRAQPKAWDYPETPEGLRQLTGMEWRDLGLAPNRVAEFNRLADESYRPDVPAAGDWERLPPRWQSRLWDRAWATRQHGWLVIASTDEIRDDPWHLHAQWISAPELDQESAERSIFTLWDTIGVGGQLVETDDPRLRYAIWVYTFDLRGRFGMGPLPNFDVLPDIFLWDLRALTQVARLLSEAR